MHISLNGNKPNVTDLVIRGVAIAGISKTFVSLVMIYNYDNSLTNWGRDKMAAILQMTLSNAFSWKKRL